MGEQNLICIIVHAVSGVGENSFVGLERSKCVYLFIMETL